MVRESFSFLRPSVFTDMARNPFDEIERMFDQMSRQIEPFNDEFLSGSMAVDIRDAGDEYVVTADLPGFDRESIDVELARETLTIAAEQGETRATEDDEQFIRQERTERSVSRSIRLPEPVDEDGTEAQYTNGVLTVHLPKVEAADGHDIPIN